MYWAPGAQHLVAPEFRMTSYLPHHSKRQDLKSSENMVSFHCLLRIRSARAYLSRSILWRITNIRLSLPPQLILMIAIIFICLLNCFIHVSLDVSVLNGAWWVIADLANGNMRPNRKEKENPLDGSNTIVWVHAPSTLQKYGLVIANSSPRKAREPNPTPENGSRKWKHGRWLVLEVRPHCKWSKG